ncbi:MAG: GNAT family N-acetyltransferase [Chloroflexi bacterium]|nr:MAG: GNAT family N-acetyltransferase [Chloroflexota bacterium]TME45674.1 MAG: GNAT family N-acetyltransferase [Chloroflexota bacterium]
MATTGTTFSVRLVESHDLDSWLALRNQGFPWATNRARFVFSESLRVADEPVLYLGAWAADGTLAATAECVVGEDGERYVDRAESFIMVGPAYRRQGLGTRLAEEIENFARRNAIRWLEALFYERDATRTKGFLVRRGFSELERYQTGWQDPSRVDLENLDRLRTALQQRGIETATFAELDSDATRHSLYRCAMQIEHDMPHQPLADWHDAPFESWIRKMLEAPGASPDAIFVARDGDQVVGLSYLVMRGDGDAEVGDTGVIGSHRRRGIARVLKMMATRWAAARGVPRVQTDNRSDNAAMLAINTELGFEPGEVIIVFEKTLRR